MTSKEAKMNGKTREKGKGGVFVLLLLLLLLSLRGGVERDGEGERLLS